MSPLRHYGGFVLAGSLALATDALILQGLHAGLGITPFLARLPAIACAMVVSWLVNRTVTFATAEPPSMREFAKFAAVSWSAQAVNYTVFAAILLALPGTAPLAALVAAALVAMFVSYVGFRFGVFRST
jgi:putative flippase GtrA